MPPLINVMNAVRSRVALKTLGRTSACRVEAFPAAAHRLTDRSRSVGIVNMSPPTGQTLGRRLQQARAMRGWSLRVLAAAVGGAVSHNAVAKYERGEMMPGSETLIALAGALGVPVDFFFRPYRVVVNEVRFSPGCRLSLAQRKATQARVADYVERYREAEEEAGDVREFTPLAVPPAVSPAAAEQAADALREAWRLGDVPLTDILGLMENHGIKVLELPMPGPGFTSMAIATDRGPVVVVGDHLHDNLPLKRLTAVRELGRLAAPLVEGGRPTERDSWLDAFAGALLVPARSLIDACGGQRRRFMAAEWAEMQAYFGVPLGTLLRRALFLGLIEPRTFRTLRKQATGADPTPRRAPGDGCSADCESPRRLRHLVRRALAEGRISVSKAATLLGEPVSRVRQEQGQQIG